MKIKILYIGLSIFLLSWIIPSLVQLTMDSSPRYPFTYYSSVINQFCYLDQDNDNVRGKDMSGKSTRTRNSTGCYPCSTIVS